MYCSVILRRTHVACRKIVLRVSKVVVSTLLARVLRWQRLSVTILLRSLPVHLVLRTLQLPQLLWLLRLAQELQTCRVLQLDHFLGRWPILLVFQALRPLW